MCDGLCVIMKNLVQKCHKASLVMYFVNLSVNSHRLLYKIVDTIQYITTVMAKSLDSKKISAKSLLKSYVHLRVLNHARHNW